VPIHREAHTGDATEKTDFTVSALIFNTKPKKNKVFKSFLFCRTSNLRIIRPVVRENMLFKKYI